jgi:2-polyprenyl-3-methyl-5-hydroxy-6-metoxy-1,4-benzoquinol methylase
MVDRAIGKTLRTPFAGWTRPQYRPPSNESAGASKKDIASLSPFLILPWQYAMSFFRRRNYRQALANVANAGIRKTARDVVHRLMLPAESAVPMTPAEYCIVYAEHMTALARRFGVKSAIHPDDHIFTFLLAHPGFRAEPDRATYYFEDGARSRMKLESLTKELLLNDRHSLLEFASGYGCVTRHLAYSSADLWVCDIHPAAVSFLQRDLGVRAFLSSPFPEMLEVQRQFDVVFALSFFSHMPIQTWARWLVRLVQTTRPGGFVIFTTHGLKSRQHFARARIPPTGFWFAPVSEQHDLPTEQYGSTITTHDFVKRAIASIHGVKLIKFEEAAWWSLQNLYVLQVMQ